ncbi:hypothetical protein L484_026957 [Morus notabilis]|uniref:Uncharacterized protein n=1 Tax=Morus notabilis TaxID=981085 RepID=W9R1A0_9ROSA|nr:hypothetical protein L484_026957 [Morus notabilis]
MLASSSSSLTKSIEDGIAPKMLSCGYIVGSYFLALMTIVLRDMDVLLSEGSSAGRMEFAR